MQTGIIKLNIAMICDPIGDNKSGVVVSTIRFAKVLAARGHNVVFIGAKLKNIKKQEYYNGIKTYRFRSIPVPKSGGWRLALPTTRELKKIFKEEKIDVVHIILPMSGSLIATKAARSLNIKLVAHSHSQPENLFTNIPKFIQPIMYKIWNSYLTWRYEKAEALIYPTEMAKGLLKKLEKIGQMSYVISNGINTKEFKPNNIENFYEKFSIPKNCIKILFVGRLFPEKSVDTLIKAIPHIITENKNIHIMIVGDGYLRPRLEKIASSLDIEKYITFLGLVSEEDKINAFNACDVFVLPSIAELEGMVVLEAMACGKPIIISDSEMSASRFFVNGNGFLFETSNPNSLAEKILQLVLAPELRKKMGQISLENSKNYNLEKSVDKLEAVYYSVIKK